MIVVTCLGSVYTLVLMSLDRFLAVVHPISSMSIRTERNALMYVKLKRQSGKLFPFLFFLYFRATLLAWFFIFTTAIPTAICHGEVTYMHKGDNHTACLFLSEQGYNHSLFQVRSQLGSSYIHTLSLHTPSVLCVLPTQASLLLVLFAYATYNSPVNMSKFIFI